MTEKLIRPRPVTPELFSGRIEGVDASTAGAMYKALKMAELLNATDFLKEDPRCAPNALTNNSLRSWRAFAWKGACLFVGKHVRTPICLNDAWHAQPPLILHVCFYVGTNALQRESKDARTILLCLFLHASKTDKYACMCKDPDIVQKFWYRLTLTKWQPVLKAIPGMAGIGLDPETSPVFEELNLAWARHELISDHLDEV